MSKHQHPRIVPTNYEPVPYVKTSSKLFRLEMPLPPIRNPRTLSTPQKVIYHPFHPHQLRPIALGDDNIKVDLAGEVERIWHASPGSDREEQNIQAI